MKYPLFISIASALVVVPPVPALAESSDSRQYIVHFDRPADARAAVQRSVGAHAATRSRRKRSLQPAAPVHVRSLSSSAELFDAGPAGIRELEATPGVIAIEEDRLLQRTSVADPSGPAVDPLWIRQWYLHDARVGIDAPVAWRYTRGEGAVVAVLDTGITPHPEFDGQLLPGFDFITDDAAARDGDGRDADPTDEGDWLGVGDCGSVKPQPSSWHGSHVAGIIAARSGNALGMSGVAPRAKIVPVRVLGRCGARLSDIADAVTWASGGQVPGAPAVERRADVINLSLGGAGPCGLAMQQAIAGARGRGTAVVVSAGNSGAPATAFTPANCPGVIPVGALARDGSMAWYSNHGAGLALVAPGGSLLGVARDDILSAVDGGLQVRHRPVFAYYAGTSMAAPQVSGVVALMRAADPAIGVDMITQQLVDNARPVPGRCPRGCGAGLLDAGATIDAVIEDRR